ncbi:FG-GAP repeat domain-containing protein [Streptomyces sp. NPDC056600]|uniref:FG-GAP repeat domain-containing protein n=1 Tax=Streptomyces sp. NPDC056600 TaxID=3345874 RepID=UPI0036897E32
MVRAIQVPRTPRAGAGRGVGRPFGLAAAALAAVLLAAGCGAGRDAGKDPAAGQRGGTRSPAAGGSGKGAQPSAAKPSGPARPDDFNGDGYDDLAAVVEDGTVVIVDGSAKGLDPGRRTVVPRSPDWTSTLGYWPVQLFRTDLDGDGFTDLLRVPAMERMGRPDVLWGGSRGVGDPKPLTGAAKSLAAVGDFDGDGHDDLFLPGGAEGPEGTVWFGPVGRGGEPARTQELKNGHWPDSIPAGAVAGDFDGDKATDLALTFHALDLESEGDGDVQVSGLQYLKGGPDGLKLAERRERPEIGFRGTPGDVDGDGTDDLFSARFDPTRKVLGVGYWLSTRSGPETGKQDGVGAAPPPGLKEGLHYSGMGGSALGDVTGDGRPDLVTSATGANDNNGVVWLVPNLLEGDASAVQAVTLDSPGVPGSDTPAPGRGPTRNRISVIDLIDTDGDQHLDVVFGSAGFLNPKSRDVDAFWVMRGTDDGMRYQQHFTTADLR